MKLGINIGNSFTYASLLKKGVEQPISISGLSSKKSNIPTTICIKDNKFIYVGKTAMNMNIYNAHFKLIQGFMDDIKNKAYFVNDKQKWSAKMLCSAIIAKIIKDVKITYPEGVQELVLTYPPYYSKEEKKVLKDAVKLTGEKLRGMVNAPIAVYKYYMKDTFFNGKYSLNIHLEGEKDGYIALIAADDVRNYKVLDSTRLIEVGNATFEEKIYQIFQQAYFKNSIIAPINTNIKRHISNMFGNLIREVIETENTQTQVGFWYDNIFKITLSINDIKSIVEEDTTKLVHRINLLLRENHLLPSHIEAIFFSGNYYCFDLLKRYLQRELSVSQIQCKYPEKVISYGAVLADVEKERIILDFDNNEKVKDGRDINSNANNGYKRVRLNWNDTKENNPNTTNKKKIQDWELETFNDMFIYNQ